MPAYAGMTVNEKLVISGQMAEWDGAVAKRDRARMIEILMATELTAEQAASTTDTTLGNPEKYGVPAGEGVKRLLLHCEPPGHANARPMTGSAKQSISPRMEPWNASSLRSSQ